MRVLVFVGYERLFDNKMESKKYNTWNKSKSNIKSQTEAKPTAVTHKYMTARQRQNRQL